MEATKLEPAEFSFAFRTTPGHFRWITCHMLRIIDGGFYKLKGGKDRNIYLN